MLLPQDFTFKIPKHEHMRELHLASFRNTEQNTKIKWLIIIQTPSFGLHS